jgi:hypothetical protein
MALLLAVETALRITNPLLYSEDRLERVGCAGYVTPRADFDPDPDPDPDFESESESEFK